MIKTMKRKVLLQILSLGVFSFGLFMIIDSKAQDVEAPPEDIEVESIMYDVNANCVEKNIGDPEFPTDEYGGNGSSNYLGSFLQNTFSFSGMNTLDEVVVTRVVAKPKSTTSCGNGGFGLDIGSGIAIPNLNGWWESMIKVTLKKLAKIDPCADRAALNDRKTKQSTVAKNNEIKNLTLQTGKEHGYNTYMNLNTKEVTNYTSVDVGHELGDGVHEVASQERWQWKANDQVEVTVDYTHTHGFESAPSSIDVFSGIGIYMATSNANMDALSPAQKQVYLSYHSINVMTANHDYAITITDPVKWVNRYPNRQADFEKYRNLTERYSNQSYDWHTAQELALIELYGDMMQLYRSDVGAANFKPLNAKIDPSTFRKFIAINNCN
jgi:hypothetical protein